MILVYTTCKNKREAEKISSHLLRKRLCACTNYFKIGSVYYWKGKLVNDNEYGLVIKTGDRLFSAVRKALREIHSYMTPCILKIKVDKTDNDYARWLRKHIRKA